MGDAVTPQTERRNDTEVSLEGATVSAQPESHSELQEVSLSSSFKVKRKQESDALQTPTPRTPKLNTLKGEVKQSQTKSKKELSLGPERVQEPQTVLDNIITSLADFISQLDRSLFEKLDPQDVEEELEGDELLEAMLKEQRKRNEREIRKLLAEKNLPPEDLETVLQALELLTGDIEE